jgi:hypothetical protein
MSGQTSQQVVERWLKKESLSRDELAKVVDLVISKGGQFVHVSSSATDPEGEPCGNGIIHWKHPRGIGEVVESLTRAGVAGAGVPARHPAAREGDRDGDREVARLTGARSCC